MKSIVKISFMIYFAGNKDEMYHVPLKLDKTKALPLHCLSVLSVILNMNQVVRVMFI